MTVVGEELRNGESSFYAKADEADYCYVGSEVAYEELEEGEGKDKGGEKLKIRGMEWEGVVPPRISLEIARPRYGMDDWDV